MKKDARLRFKKSEATARQVDIADKIDLRGFYERDEFDIFINVLLPK